MGTLFLSGVGGSTNWLPLIFPLIAIVGAIVLSDSITGYIKKRKLVRENRLINELSSHAEPPATPVDNSEQAN